MATNFSPCKGSYVLNQFPSNVMFGMNGFHVSASGAIQGHHGPLVHSVLWQDTVEPMPRTVESRKFQGYMSGLSNLTCALKEKDNSLPQNPNF